LMLGGPGREQRSFDVKDGAGLVLARRLGWRTGFLSGRGGSAVAERARELQIDEVHLEVDDKPRVYEGIKHRLRLADAEVCYMGDDLMDLGVLLRAGLAVAPADAHPEVRRRVPFVTRARGGRGAVREVVDAIARAQGRWAEMIGWFTGAKR
ncbi:MAG TPA: phenylphosphate carboxylase subunit delta, partial [Candidatus Polarisedimenticolia bacterium]|nr:phenylphosphate carboxylase subunit delta [Candidatus Polarisedimenticolia bacterium]